MEGYRTYLSCAFKRAVEVDNLMDRNPFAGVKLAAEAAKANPGRGEDKQKRLPFTLREIRFMLDHFPAPWGDMVAVSWYLAGLRLSDVCLLRWDAVDRQKGYVRIVEQKTGKERYLPLIPELRAVLERLQGQAAGEEYVFPLMAHYYLSGANGYVSTQFTALLRAHGNTECNGETECKTGCLMRSLLCPASKMSINDDFFRIGMLLHVFFCNKLYIN